VNAAPLLFLLVVAAAFWLLMVRPQQRRARAQQDLQAALSVGDEVMTTSGIFGEVRALEGETVHLAVAEGVEIRVVRAAIARVVPPTTDTNDEQTDPAETTAEPEETQ
jgi:preprotein translocase subunit YajC